MPFDLDFNASYLVAFAMGLFSSLHCIGMCGSIIGTLSLSLTPEVRNNKAALFSYVLNYNIGRICSYTLAGGLVGVLQFYLTLPFNEGQAHRLLQIFAAAIMTGAGFYIAGWFPRFAYIEKIGARWWKLVEPYGRKLNTGKKPFPGVFIRYGLGLAALRIDLYRAGFASTAGSILHSALTMLAFGLGTLPAVMGIGIMTGMLSRLSKIQRFKQVVGILFIFIALLAAFPWLNPMRLHHLLKERGLKMDNFSAIIGKSPPGIADP